MYEEHFGLRCKPFGAPPDESFVVATGNHARAFSDVKHSLLGGHRIALITGAAGVGKSLVARRMLSDLAEHCQVVLMATANFTGVTGFLKSLLFELNAEFENRDLQELRLRLTARLREEARQGRRTVLIVDEAHNLDADVLAEIRSTTEITQEGQLLLQAVLVGQLPLEETLTSPQLAAFNERIGCHVVLEPLSRNESREYIDQRLQKAGCRSESLLPKSVVEFAIRASDGSPRCLNQLLDHCLLLAFAQGDPAVNGQHARQALDDLKHLPLHWHDPGSLSPGNDEPEGTAGNAEEPAVELVPERSAPVAELDTGAMQSADAFRRSPSETTPLSVPESLDVARRPDGPDAGPHSDKLGTSTMEVGFSPDSDPVESASGETCEHVFGDDSAEGLPCAAEPNDGDGPDRHQWETAIVEVGAGPEDAQGEDEADCVIPEFHAEGAETVRPAGEAPASDIADALLSAATTDEDELRVPRWKDVDLSRENDAGLSEPMPVSECETTTSAGTPDSAEHENEQPELFDRYAWLDAGRAIPEDFADVPVLAPIDSEPDYPDPFLPDSQTLVTRDADPVDNLTNCPPQPQSECPAERMIPAHYDASPATTAGLRTGQREDAAFETDQVDVSLESSLLEDCQEARRELENAVGGQTVDLSTSFGHATGYDVIEPDVPPEPDGQHGQSPTAAAQSFERRYQDLFSRLRQRANRGNSDSL